jgi:hypothetical protein
MLGCARRELDQAVQRAASGRAGRQQPDVVPGVRSAGTTPARTREDLPDPDGPTTASTPCSCNRSRQAADVRVTAEEAVGVLLLVGEQAGVGAGRRDVREGAGTADPRVLPEDRCFELHQVPSGIDAELLGELLAGTTQGLERLALQTSLVLRRREQRPPSFAQRRLGDAKRRFVQDLAPASDPEERLEPQVLGHAPEFRKTFRLEPRWLPAREVALERRPTPECQGVLDHRGSTVVLAEREELPAPLDGPLEPADVDASSASVRR